AGGSADLSARRHRRAGNPTGPAPATLIPSGAGAPDASNHHECGHFPLGPAGDVQRVHRLRAGLVDPDSRAGGSRMVPRSQQTRGSTRPAARLSFIADFWSVSQRPFWGVGSTEAEA